MSDGLTDDLTGTTWRDDRGDLRHVVDIGGGPGSTDIYEVRRARDGVYWPVSGASIRSWTRVPDVIDLQELPAPVKPSDVQIPRELIEQLRVAGWDLAKIVDAVAAILDATDES